MSVEIRVPPLGESVVEATVGRWTKQEGDTVAKDEILVELETDKITVEVAAQSAGTLARIAKQEGDTVGVDELLAELQPSGDGAGAASPADQAGHTASARYEEKPASEQPAEAAPTGEAQTSPAVRALAAEHDLDLGTVRGSGPNGRITKEDVLRVIEDGRQRAAAQPRQAAAPAPA
ncbi:MAG TPA: biotin/lipoyl-containing protein, partial [Longimicrobiaceae bacterium]|nr:biotin/lipoyl-containing protein [Longimicrobiaceae bacterium]